MTKRELTTIQKEHIKTILPLLKALQREYRGLATTRAEYREAKYAEVFQEDGVPLVDDYAFIKFLEVETTI